MPNSLGHFTTVDWFANHTITIAAGGLPVILLALWTPSGLRAITFNGGDPSGGTANSSRGDIQARAQMASPNAPKTIRPLRMGVRILNLTRADEVGGLVHTLNTPDDMNFLSAFGPDPDHGSYVAARGYANAWNDVQSSIVNHQAAVRSTGSAFTQGINLIAIPASTIGMTEYRQFSQVLAEGDGAGTAAIYNSKMAALNLGYQHRSVNAICAIFWPTTTTQTYMIEMKGQDACTFAANSMGSRFSRPPPPPGPFPARAAQSVVAGRLVPQRMAQQVPVPMDTRMPGQSSRGRSRTPLGGPR